MVTRETCVLKVVRVKDCARLQSFGILSKITFFKKKVKKGAKYTLFSHNQNRTIILSFKKVLYILSIKKYDIRKWR